MHDPFLQNQSAITCWISCPVELGTASRHRSSVSHFAEDRGAVSRNTLLQWIPSSYQENLGHARIRSIARIRKARYHIPSISLRFFRKVWMLANELSISSKWMGSFSEGISQRNLNTCLELICKKREHSPLSFL